MALDATLDATADGDVRFEFAVVNDGSEPVEVTFSSGQTADVAAYDGDDLVWRWSDDRMFTMAMRTETLAPGERIEEEFVWSDPPAGEYRAVGSLAVNRDVEATTTVTVA